MRDYIYSPYRLLLIILISIFAAEVYINVFLYLLPPLSLPVQSVLDAFLLISIIFPMLYFFLFRPMILHTNRRKQAEELLRESEGKYRSLFEQSRDPISITTREGKFIDANPAILDLFGYTREEMMKMNTRELYAYPEDREKFMQEVEQKGAVKDFELKFRRKDGTEIDCLLTSTVRRAEDGRFIGYQGMIRDVTESKQTEEKLRYLSTHDPLTGLYNRAYFEEEMARLERSRQFPISVVMVDVDGLKEINDTHGHAAGDELLRQAARLLRASFRVEDGVARIGGDEFSVLLPMTDVSAAAETLTRVKDNIAARNRTSSTPSLRLSLGTATCEKGEMLARVFKKADEHMYENKLARREKCK